MWGENSCPHCKSNLHSSYARCPWWRLRAEDARAECRGSITEWAAQYADDPLAKTYKSHHDTVIAPPRKCPEVEIAALGEDRGIVERVLGQWLYEIGEQRPD
eukprot:7337319-Alexandrium_andersonii.AAC.1